MVSSDTLALSTPRTPRSAASTEAEHDAHVMPLTNNDTLEASLPPACSAL